MKRPLLQERATEDEQIIVVSAMEELEAKGLEAILAEADIRYLGNAKLDCEFDALIQNTKAHVGIVSTGVRDILFTVLQKAKRGECALPCIITDWRHRPVYGKFILRVGAAAYKSHDCTGSELIKTIHSVVKKNHCTMAPSAEARETPTCGILSPRQWDVLKLTGEGMNTQSIASTLRRSPKTIEAHKEHIKRKLNLANAAELLQCAVWFTMTEILPTDSADSLRESGTL